MQTITNTNTNTKEINDVLKEINGVLETAINTNTVLNTDEISEVLGVIRGVLETITETTANNANETENEVDLADVLETLLETSSNESENDNMESKTWTEPYFLDSTGASKVLKEWADRTSESFFEEHSDNGIIHNIHPDYTAVRVPVRFHRELRKLGMARDYRSSGTYLWEGVWYFPADREFLELVESE